MSAPLTRSGMRDARRARSERRAELVAGIYAAVDDFSKQGVPFSEVSVDQLAAAAGISRSSFYRYFGDKSEVLVELSEDLFAERRAAGNAIWFVPPTAPRDAVRDAFRTFLAVCWQHRAAGSAIANAQTYDPRIREITSQVGRDAVALICSHIEQGQTEGWVRSDIQVLNTAKWLVAMNDRGIAALLATAELSEVERLADGLSSIVWYALYEGARDPTGTDPPRAI